MNKMEGIIDISQTKHLDPELETSGMIVKVRVGPKSVRMTCPSCQADVKTAVRHTSTTRTHFLALRMLACCCCCIPYCCNSARNTDHYCPSCGEYINTYEK